jgi:endonuclease III
MPRTAPPLPDPKAQARRVVSALVRLYPDTRCALVHEGAYQLLVATILSAQCTDARVNMVTPALFARFPDAARLAVAEQEEVEELIHSAGFFRAKARNLRAMAAQVVNQHDGEIPADLDALTALAGVGRKTAHVVLGNAFNIASGVVVDTHVKRLAFRLGLTTSRDPTVIERELIQVVPKTHWVNFSHRLIDHGRKVCIARKPHCSECTLAKLCPKQGVTSSD